MELGGDGTTVNAVAPGPVVSEMLDLVPDELVASQKGSTAVERRVAVPEEVAEIVAFLVGEGGRWVSGQTISATGGWAKY